MKSKVNKFAFALSLVFFLGTFSFPIYSLAEEVSNDSNTEYEKKSLLVEEYKKKIAEKKEELKKKAEEQANQIKKQAEEQANQLKEKADQKQLELRKQQCEKIADKLGSAIDRKAGNAKEYSERFSGFADKVDRFVEQKQLVIEDDVALSQNIIDKKSNVDEAILKLEQLKDFEINCDEVDLTKINTQNYRDAVVEVKSALKEYKTALVDYLKLVVTSYNQSVENKELESEDTSDNNDQSDTSSQEDTNNSNLESEDEGVNNVQ